MEMRTTISNPFLAAVPGRTGDKRFAGTMPFYGRRLRNAPGIS